MGEVAPSSGKETTWGRWLSGSCPVTSPSGDIPLLSLCFGTRGQTVGQLVRTITLVDRVRATSQALGFILHTSDLITTTPWQKIPTYRRGNNPRPRSLLRVTQFLIGRAGLDAKALLPSPLLPHLAIALLGNVACPMELRMGCGMEMPEALLPSLGAVRMRWPGL